MKAIPHFLSHWNFHRRRHPWAVGCLAFVVVQVLLLGVLMPLIVGEWPRVIAWLGQLITLSWGMLATIIAAFVLVTGICVFVIAYGLGVERKAHASMTLDETIEKIKALIAELELSQGSVANFRFEQLRLSLVLDTVATYLRDSDKDSYFRRIDALVTIYLEACNLTLDAYKDRIFLIQPNNSARDSATVFRLLSLQPRIWDTMRLKDNQGRTLTGSIATLLSGSSSGSAERVSKRSPDFDLSTCLSNRVTHQPGAPRYVLHIRLEHKGDIKGILRIEAEKAGELGLIENYPAFEETMRSLGFLMHFVEWINAH